jgi:hypothetical protein
MSTPELCAFDTDPFVCQTITELFFYGTRQSGSWVEDTLSNLLQYVASKGTTAQAQTTRAFGTTAQAQTNLSLLIRLILYTRDANNGKGERTLTYAMMYALYPYAPSLVLRILTHLVYGTLEPIGGWVDARRLAEYVYSRTDGNVAHPIIHHAVFMINNHLYMDKQMSTWSDATYYLSTVSRWIPRERSGSTWFFDELSRDWCVRYTPHLLPRTHCSAESQQRAVRKYKADYRRLVSRLSALAPRDKPANGLGDWVAKARDVLRQPNNQTRVSAINRQWTNALVEHWKDHRGLVGNVLPVIDISRGMEGDALLSAIGVACLLLETTTLEKRVLTIDQTPTWVVVPEQATFVETVDLLLDAVSRFGRTVSRIERGIQLLDSSFRNSGMTRAEIRALTLVFVLDMHSYVDWGVGELDESIRCAFSGSVPHLVYWNVCSEFSSKAPSVLPCDHDRYGVNVVSGDGFECLLGILPKWRFDGDRNKQYIVSNTPYEGVVSVLSSIDLSFFDGYSSSSS